MEESHTGEHIAAQMEWMLQNWEIPRDKVHIVISDNASNMVKAMNDASFSHFGCFAHSLQLVIKDGLFVQRTINDILAIMLKHSGTLSSFFSCQPQSKKNTGKFKYTST